MVSASLLEPSRTARSEDALPLRTEAHEFVALTVASIRTARPRARVGTPNPQSAIRNPQ